MLIFFIVASILLGTKMLPADDFPRHFETTIKHRIAQTAIIYLAHSERLEELFGSLEMLFTNYLDQFPTQILIFHEQSIDSSKLKRHLQQINCTSRCLIVVENIVDNRSTIGIRQVCLTQAFV